MLTLLPSQTTLEPVCPHFGECGGCLFQTISYEEQLQKKEEFVKSIFSNMPGTWHPILPSTPFWNYRNKMEFSFSQSKKGERFLGLMMKKGRGKVVNLSQCHIAPTWMVEVLNEVRLWWQFTELKAYHPPTNTGHLRTLTTRESPRNCEKMVILTTTDASIEEEQLQNLKERLKKKVALHSFILRKQIVAKKTPTTFIEQVLDGNSTIYETLYVGQTPLRFKIRASSFFQPNTLQAEKFYQKALELAELEGGETLLDLYCGIGTIGLFASKKVKKVIGIEINADAVKDAKENILLNSAHNMEVFEGDVGKVPLDVRPDVIIVDPPRAGLSEDALKWIGFLAPKKLIYISCNPVTQAQNIQELSKEGYQTVHFQPVDAFPHTPHIENVIALHKAF